MNFCTVCQGTGIVGSMAPCAHCVGHSSSFIAQRGPNMNIGHQLNQPSHFGPQEPSFFPQPDPTFPDFPHDDKSKLCMSPFGVPWDLCIPHEIHPDVVPHDYDNKPEIV